MLSYIKELGRKSRKMRWARLQVGNPANRLHLRNSLLITTSSTGLRQQLNVLTSSSFLLNSLKGVMQWLIQRKHFACKTRRLVKRQKTKIMAERQKQNHSKHNRSYSGRRKRYMKDLAMQLDTSYVPVTMACPQSRRSGFSVWLSHRELRRLKQSPCSHSCSLLYLTAASLCSANTSVSGIYWWTRTWDNIFFSLLGKRTAYI